MKVGIISDIHSNSEALWSVIQELNCEGINHIINAGDNVGYSAHPDICVKMIQAEGFYNVMGNYDDAVANDRDECGCGEGEAETQRLRKASLQWTQKNTSPETKHYLASLPHRLEVEIGGKKIFAIHGGLELLNEFIYEDNTAAMEKLADAVEADVVVLGHTHKPFIREIKGKLFVNPGSVGKPVDGNPRASFAVTDLSDTIRAEIRRVEYDVQKNLEDITASGLPERIGEIIKNAEETSGTNVCELTHPGRQAWVSFFL